MSTSKIILMKNIKRVYMSAVVIQADDYCCCELQPCKIVEVPRDTKMNVYHYEQNKIIVYSYPKRLKTNQINLYKRAISILNRATSFVKEHLNDLEKDAHK